MTTPIQERISEIRGSVEAFCEDFRLLRVATLENMRAAMVARVAILEEAVREVSSSFPVSYEEEDRTYCRVHPNLVGPIKRALNASLARQQRRLKETAKASNVHRGQLIEGLYMFLKLEGVPITKTTRRAVRQIVEQRVQVVRPLAPRWSTSYDGAVEFREEANRDHS